MKNPNYVSILSKCHARIKNIDTELGLINEELVKPYLIAYDDGKTFNVAKSSIEKLEYHYGVIMGKLALAKRCKATDRIKTHSECLAEIETKFKLRLKISELWDERNELNRVMYSVPDDIRREFIDNEVFKTVAPLITKHKL